MINPTYPPQCRTDTVTISADEYGDLIRGTAQLDAMLILIANTGSVPECLTKAFAQERSIATVKEVPNGNREAVLLDEAQGELHDLGHN